MSRLKITYYFTLALFFCASGIAASNHNHDTEQDLATWYELQNEQRCITRTKNAARDVGKVLLGSAVASSCFGAIMYHSTDQEFTGLPGFVLCDCMNLSCVPSAILCNYHCCIKPKQARQRQERLQELNPALKELLARQESQIV